MNNRSKPPHYSSFKEYGNEATRKEPPPEQHNFAQLINWMSELKNGFTKLGQDLADYRLQQARQIMEWRDTMRNIVNERDEILKTMEMILQHLTEPGSVKIAGATMPAADAIALKVAELLKRPLLVHKAMENVAPVEENVTDRDEMVQKHPESSAIIPSGNNPPRKRINDLEKKMIEVMRGDGHHTANTIHAALSVKYPDLDFNKPSIASGLSLMLKADKVKRLDRGVYQLTLWAPR